MKTHTYIYALKDPRTQEVHYIGKSDNPYSRYKQHCQAAGDNAKKKNWIKDLRDHGLKPEMVILEQTQLADWEKRERYWIKFGHDEGWPLTNIAPGGKCNLGLGAYARMRESLKQYIGNDLFGILDELSDERLLDIATEAVLTGIDDFRGYFLGKTDGMAAYTKISKELDRQLRQLV